MSRFKRKLSREAQRLKEEIEATPVSDEEAAAAKMVGEKIGRVLDEFLSAGVASELVCAGLAGAAASLGDRMCDEKGGAEEPRAAWLVFFVSAVGEALEGIREAAKQERGAVN